MNPIPHHVAIIMDGNGRWATQRGLSRIFGHLRGVRSAKSAILTAIDMGIPHITLFAFSTENFSRPASEVQFLMRLFERHLRHYTAKLIQEKIHCDVIGDLSALPPSLQEAINYVERSTASHQRLHLHLAINYGARAEILTAIQSICADPTFDPASLTWEKLTSYLYTKAIPDPDLIIRTSGEMRLSNFLLLQSAYAELYFIQRYWPEFSPSDFRHAIHDYQQRTRKMGNIQ